MILCAGEALIDMLPRALAGGGEAFLPVAGGSVFNTAIALGRLGAPVGFLSGLSDDLFGQLLCKTLEDSGVTSALSLRSSRPTTLAFVTLTDGHAEYAFYDENTAGRMIRPEDLPADLGSVEALFLGGISLVSEPCAEAYAALAAREAAARVIMLDPNIRPGFISDEARYRARIDGLLRLADIVKVSDEDLAWLFPEAEGPDAQIAALLDRGPRIACLTRGAQGASAICRDGRQIDVPARPVQVVDTVGAGDTFNAGVLAGLRDAGVLSKAALEQAPDSAIETALELGIRAAAVTVSRAGANPPVRAEL